ncbi:MAG TPA: cupin domain-containing protein [Bryobacteraceae bacterium]|nr:cupin domain-containing protein [Bryobacteraceae bacterium]
MTSQEYWISHLNLQHHPEGGFFRETYRAPLAIPHSALPASFRDSRRASTAIYFLIAGEDFSALHRLAADEVWHFYAGSALLIHCIDRSGNYSIVKLGQNPENGEQFQCVIPAGDWFGSCLERPDTYALVGCTVAPGFDFADFEMAQRADLLTDYPQHKDVIEKLTRR